MRFLSSALALTLAGHASGAVIGIDLGARFLKVGIIQPGTGIELVLNEATKRKSSSAAGFNSADERVYGDESFNLLGSRPAQQFVLSKLLLGKQLTSDEVRSFNSLRYPYTFESDGDTGAALLRYDVNTTYRSEEMVAFVLSYAKQIAEAHAKSAVKDCVITLPPFFGADERNSLMSAASIAGLNVLSLMHENTAFAFKYGFDKENEFKGDTPTNVVFYDLGATSYKVSVVSFSTIVGKKNKTTGSMAVKGIGYDSTLGGRNFDAIVLDIMAEEFNEKALKGKADVRDFPKAMGKLRKSSESVKDILSANMNYQLGIEALHDDRDLRMVISRETFDARAEKAGLWARLTPPLEAALAQANLTKEDIHRVEVVGGATRILKVKEVAKAFFGRTQLDGSLNGDEAAAMGATLYAAKLSTSFRLRDFGIADSYVHATSIRITGSDGEEARPDEAEGEAPSTKGKDKLLFKAGTKFPHKKLITMTRVDDLTATLSAGEPTGDLAPISKFNISGVAAAYERLQKDTTRQVTSKPKVSITFALSSSGLVDVAKAEMAIEMLEKYNDTEYVVANETNANMTRIGEELAIAAALHAEAVANATAANRTAPNASTAPRMVPITVLKERKRLHYVTLKASKTHLGAVTPIDADEVQRCIGRNLELLAAEQTRRTNAEAKNAVESFIIDTRDKLSSDERMGAVSTDEERAAISSEFETVEDWLYEEGRNLDAAAYAKRKKELSAMTAPLFLRAHEMEARPKAITQANDAINWTLTILDSWASERPEVTTEERDHVSGLCANLTSWMQAQEEAQAALTAFDAPAYLSTDLAARLEPIERQVRKLIKKPKPKPPKATPKNTSNATGVNTGVNATSADDGAELPHVTPAADAGAEPPKEEL